MLLAILIAMFLNVGCKPNHNYFPDRKDVLTADYSQYDNFFPLAIFDLSSKGIKDKIHVMYVSFDPSIDHKKPFPDNDYIDAFSFKISDEGKLLPMFDKSALIISEDFKKYFIEGQEKFKNVKQNKNPASIIDFSNEPDWWQDDKTPFNSKGKPMTFVCQMDIYEVFNDDCRLFVFYDQDDKVIKYIYQRD